jgi:hypothetical protein
LAETLYHEVGHHVHSKTAEYQKIQNRLAQLRRKLGRKGADESRGDKRHERARFFELGQALEDFANSYACRSLQKAEALGLMDKTQKEDVLFFKIMCDRFVKEVIKHYEQERVSYPCGKLVAVFDFLRKQKLGGLHYNLTEAYLSIFGQEPNKATMSRFRADACRLVHPTEYTSKRGRKTLYLSQAQIQILKQKLNQKSDTGGDPIEPQ